MSSASMKDEKVAYTTDANAGDSSTGFVDDLEVQLTERELIENEDGLHRGLKSRHIQLIALGGCIGTGLFVGTGSSLAKCGPAGLLTGYLILATVIFFVMNMLGEMVCYLPQKGGAVSDLAKRYVGPDLGFATGWIYYYTFVILIATEVTAAAIVIEYWTKKVHVAVWIVIFLAVIIALNFLAVRFYGESEFWFASLKILCILGLIIVGIVIFFGGGPNQKRVLGFHYWKTPGAFAYHLLPGNTGRFLDCWTAVIKSGFAFIVGPELVAIATAETQRPRRNISKAAKRFVYRIMFFYVVGSLVIGVVVPYNNPNLLSGTGNATASPFVIGIKLVGINVLDHIINACILSSAWSSGNSFFYAGSRFLKTMAEDGDAPKIFAITNRHGVPYVACALTALISLLAFLNVSSSGAQVFTWFSNLCTISGFIGWIIVAICYLRWRKAVLYNNLWDRVPFKTRAQPFGAYYVIFIISLICITNGYEVFFDFNGPDFVAAYLTLPVFFLLYFGWKVWKKHWSWGMPIEEIDIVSGLDQAEKIEAEFEARAKPVHGVLQKFLDWLL
ncbi:CYFA0S01e16050g1_1 [Cyberlindnera fabianii]|uniref:CYFA0S01e16050g1_1 n=1 Tax=Cyberlindnera fabianii TaxID=36022 RepID=A0A061AJJ7_CYBFA|nr:Proline-specific permease [Cyberlindnera fabianii]CDR37735.1 CYFA0S01e16050g1_1 [Cyberlindnera fabianii]